jgi:hypothetical protein
MVDSDHCQHIVCESTLRRWFNLDHTTCPVCLSFLRSSKMLAFPLLASSIQDCIRKYNARDYSSTLLLEEHLSDMGMDNGGAEEEKSCSDDDDDDDDDKENHEPPRTVKVLGASMDEENCNPNLLPAVGVKPSGALKRRLVLLNSVHPSPNKRPRTTKVQFLPDPTNPSRVFAKVHCYAKHPESKKEDTWLIRQDFEDSIRAEKKQFEFYQKYCRQLRDSIELIWTQCTELLSETDHHSELAWKFEQSPAKGMEKRMVLSDMKRRKQQLYGTVRTLQSQGGRGDFLSERIGHVTRLLSQPAARFARTMAEANAEVVQDYYKEEETMVTI